MEKRSETKIIWVVVGIIGAQLLGVDAQVMMALLGTVSQHADAAAQVAGSAQDGSTVGNVTLPTLAGLYAYLRSELKKRREGGV